MRQTGFGITFTEANWMVTNKSLRRVKTIPSSGFIMLKEDIEEYLQVDPDYFASYHSKYMVPWDLLNWLYWDTSYDAIIGAGGDAAITIYTNMAWTVNLSTVPSWLTLTSSHTGIGDTTLEFTASSNPSNTNDRTANIEIAIGSKTFYQSITQYYTPIVHEEEEFDIYEYSKTANSVTIATTNNAVDAEVSYRKQGSSTWIAADVFGSGNPLRWTIGNLEEGVQYQFQVKYQESVGSNTIIHYTSNILSVSTSIIPVLTLSESSIAVDADVTSFTFNISSNVSWSISDNRDWISTSYSGTPSGNKTITVNLHQNYSSQRSGTITVTGSGMTRTLSVTQRAISLEAVTIRGTGTMVGVYQGAPTPQQAPNNQVLYNVYATSSGTQLGLGDRFYTNQTAIQTLGGGNDWYMLQGTTKAIQIGLDGYVMQVVDTSQTLTISTSTITASNTGRTLTRSLTSNTSWVASANRNWITIDPPSGVGNNTLTITIDGHTGNSGRDAEITVRTFDNFINRKITVEQEGALQDGINPTITPPLPAAGATQRITITTNGAWGVGTLPFNVTASPMSGNGSGYTDVTIPRNYFAEQVAHIIPIIINGTQYLCFINQAGTGGIGPFAFNPPENLDDYTIIGPVNQPEE